MCNPFLFNCNIFIPPTINLLIGFFHARYWILWLISPSISLKLRIMDPQGNQNTRLVILYIFQFSPVIIYFFFPKLALHILVQPLLRSQAKIRYFRGLSLHISNFSFFYSLNSPTKLYHSQNSDTIYRMCSVSMTRTKRKI